MGKARLQELYETKVRPGLKKDLALANIMEVPQLKKIVVNLGLKEAVGDSKAIKVMVGIVGRIVGQLPIQTKARKSIAGFKIREEMPIGIKATLRGKRMYEFLDRLINLSLPMVRDFQGVGDKFDRGGNYNLGIKDWVIFPEVDYNITDKSYGMNITFHTSTTDPVRAHALLKAFGMPFKRKDV